MRDLKLLEKYQPSPPPPRHQKKENLNLQENEKTSLLVKVSTTLKMKILNFSKKNIGKVFNSFEVTRPIKPSPHEKIPIPENLTPFRKLQFSHAHKSGN